MEDKAEEKRAQQHVMFAGEPATRPSASSPLGATSPRALKILSRKKTPFTEDLQSSLEAFREMEDAKAVLEAQKMVRAEEAERLKEQENREPVVLVRTEEDNREGAHGRSVRVVSPQCAKDRRIRGEAVSALQTNTTGVPETLAHPPKKDDATL